MLAAGADFCYNENRYRVHSACALRASEGDEAGCMLPEISGKGANHLPVQYAINEKMKEAAASVLPVTVIVFWANVPAVTFVINTTIKKTPNFIT